MKYDFLIIGAGLAGCAAGRLLVQAGHSVLVVDCADLCTKDKLCGGLLTPRAWRMLHALYGDAFDEWAARVCLVKQEHHSMGVMVGSHQQVLDGVVVRGCQRRELDRYALDSIVDAGADVIDNARVSHLDILDRSTEILISGVTVPVQFKHLVVADGAGSSTRHAVCAQYQDLCHKGIIDASYRPGAFRRPREVELVPSLEAYVEPSGALLTGKYNAHLRGYDWYAPCGDVAFIGCDGAPGKTAAQLREELAIFADQMGVTINEKSIRGACIPSGGSILLELRSSTCSSARDDGATLEPVYFVGDAAGLAAPATGEGIYFALRSAQALAESFQPDSPSYRALMFEEAALLKTQYAMLDALFDEELIERVVDLAHKSKLGSSLSAKAVLKVCASF